MKTAALCELCRQNVRLRHNEPARGRRLVVGRKLNGVERVVCSRCKHRWPSMKREIMAGWPELQLELTRRGAEVVTVDTITGAETIPPLTPEIIRQKEEPVNPKPEVRVVETPKLPEGMSLRLNRHHYPAIMTEYVVEWIKRYGVKRGTFLALARQIIREHQEWVTHRNGAIIADGAVAEMVRKIAITAGLWTVSAMPKGIEPEPAKPELQPEPAKPEPVLVRITDERAKKYLARLVRDARSLIEALERAGDVDTLEAVVELMEEGR